MPSLESEEYNTDIIVFSAEYYGFPLWDRRIYGERDPEYWQLSETLVADLRSWQATFDAYYDPDMGGWPSVAMRKRHHDDGIDLLTRLQSARPDREFEYQFWQTAIRGSRSED